AGERARHARVGNLACWARPERPPGPRGGQHLERAESLAEDQVAGRRVRGAYARLGAEVGVSGLRNPEIVHSGDGRRVGGVGRPGAASVAEYAPTIGRAVGPVGWIDPGHVLAGWGARREAAVLRVEVQVPVGVEHAAVECQTGGGEGCGERIVAVVERTSRSAERRRLER